MKLYKAIRFLMLSGILTLVLSRCIRESLEGCPLDTRDTELESDGGGL